MIIEIEDFKRLKDINNNLMFEIRELSDSGISAVYHLDKLINKIESNSNNKLFVISENSVFNGENINRIVGVALSKEEADKILKDEIKKLKDDVDFDSLDATNIEDIDEDYSDSSKWVYEKDDNCFSLYLNQEYDSQHYTLKIDESKISRELDNKKEKGMEI